jgi:hypothetical protein
VAAAVGEGAGVVAQLHAYLSALAETEAQQGELAGGPVPALAS